VCWITIVNFVYLLMQIVMAADDCSVAKAWPRVGTFVRQQRRGVMGVFGVVLALVVAATGVSLPRRRRLVWWRSYPSSDWPCSRYNCSRGCFAGSCSSS
jgi:hypothetical protein